MKNNYQRMNKEEKKGVKKAYYKTERGINLKKRIVHLRIIILLSIIYVIINVSYAILNNRLTIVDYSTNGSLIIAVIIFVVASLKIEANELNWFSINMNKPENK